jgi:tellurite resistance protein
MADEQKQQRLIRYLVETLTKRNRENLVYQRFVQKLKDEGRLGILEDLDKIRRSEDIRKAQEAYFQSLNALIAEANGEIEDHVLREIILTLQLDTGESN